MVITWDHRYYRTGDQRKLRRTDTVLSEPKLLAQFLNSYDQKVPQSHTADQLTVSRGRDTEH